jgi:hypothetical protein
VDTVERVNARPVAIVDLDGVVADVRHRLHHLTGRRKDWVAFFAAAGTDPPHPEGLAVVATLAAEHDIVYVTGRPERLRVVTERWLGGHGIGGHELIMRNDRDRRPAAQLKVGIARQIAAERPVGVVVDDDEHVLAAMRTAGFTVFPAEWERRDEAAHAALTEAQETDGAT